MSLAHLAPSQRWRIRGHVGLIALWSIGLAVGCNFLFRQTPLINAPIIRHTLNAMILYFAGMLPAALVYLRWQQGRLKPHDGLLAREEEKNEYNASVDQLKQINHKNSFVLELTAYLAQLAELMPLLAAIALIALLVFVLPFILLTPLLFSEWLATGLAELIFEFVIGYALIRHANIPNIATMSYQALLRKTWVYGLIIILIGCIFGISRK